MEQVTDFREEAEHLSNCLEDLAEADWTRVTQFKGCTTNDVLVHLHFWNTVADLSATDRDAFDALMSRALPVFQNLGIRPFENDHIPERGPALLNLWPKRSTTSSKVGVPPTHGHG